MTDYLIYIKIEQNIKVVDKKVLLGNIAEVFHKDERIIKELKNIVVIDIEGEKDCKIIFSIIKIIELINEVYPQAEVINIGVNDFILELNLPKKRNKTLEYLKTCSVILIVFFGSAFAIMTFNTDASVQEIFDIIYVLLMGQAKTGPSLLELSYSLGLPIGILAFFNHIGKKKMNNDPTPIAIQMRLYEEDINATIIENSNREGKTIDSH